MIHVDFMCDGSSIWGRTMTQVPSIGEHVDILHRDYTTNWDRYTVINVKWLMASGTVTEAIVFLKKA